MKTKPYRSKAFKRFKRNRRLGFAALTILIILLSYLLIIEFQKSRYDIDNYNCVHMSNDTKAFFDALGFETRLLTGVQLNDQGKLTAHRWLQIKLPLIGWMDFESTTLTFEDVSSHYHTYKIIEDDRTLVFSIFD
jgi:hypothetical protein